VATRRKYRVPADHTTADVANVAVADAPASPAASGAPPDPSPGVEDSPLQRALEAQQHAEQLQRQHAHRQQIGLPEPPIAPAERQAIDAHIDGMGLSAHKARFLKSHPSLLTEPYRRSMAHAYQMALHAGVADDSEQMDHAILAGVARDIEHHRALSALTAASARPTPENQQMHHDAGQAAEELSREAEGHHAAFLAENPPPPPPAPRRSMPMSAPVSRDGHSLSGHSEPPGWNTLTAEERRIARSSFSAPDMSNEQKELLYLRNRQKLAKMRADGTYSEQRG
jgi:hypothetical protein